jgi:hypothetical protein
MLKAWGTPHFDKNYLVEKDPLSTMHMLEIQGEST